MDSKRSSNAKYARDRIELAISDLLKILGEVSTEAHIPPERKIEGARLTMVVISDLREARRTLGDLVAYIDGKE